MSASLGKLLVMQGGGPTQVVNASLFGVIDEASRSGRFDRILGARFGVSGMMKGDFIDLSVVPQREIELLRTTPGASLGSTRYRPLEPELRELGSLLRRHDIRSVLLIGGNGSLRGVAALAEALSDADVCVIGIPKTIDNDIQGTDRCPGYASAARYVAQSVRDLAIDVRTLPQPVSIFETMGRSVGWLAASSLLAKKDERDAPHLLYLPERSFEIDRFLGDVDRVARKNGWAIAVVAEGLQDARGNPIYETTEPSQHDSLDRPPPGGVSAHLAELVAQRLKIRCRWEKPGLCGRSSALHVSAVDRADAELVGRWAVRAAIERQTAHMVALSPLAESSDETRCELVPLPLSAGERRFPEEWITDDGNIPVAPACVQYARRIVGELIDYPLPLNEKRC
jgi:ATP-dependent phosphofructokinase / diphosphate-dependent phosphofructokinase